LHILFYDKKIHQYLGIQKKKAVTCHVKGGLQQESKKVVVRALNVIRPNRKTSIIMLLQTVITLCNIYYSSHVPVLVSFRRLGFDFCGLYLRFKIHKSCSLVKITEINKPFKNHKLLATKLIF